MTTVVMGQAGAGATDPEAEWLVDAVDAWRVAAEKPRFDPGWFHASSLGQSDDELIQRYRGALILEPRTARELRVFDLGHDRDGSWKRYLADAGLSVVAEDEARNIRLPWLRLCGSLDDIAHDPITGEWWVVEFKTINPFAYQQLATPKPEHVQQVMSYMAATTIHQAIVLYENKSDQAVRAFVVRFDPAIWREIVERLRRLRAEAERLDGEVEPNVLDMGRQLASALAE
jgi:hypothetical protein